MCKVIERPRSTQRVMQRGLCNALRRSPSMGPQKLSDGELSGEKHFTV
jgi:hypothetical protein